ncbi:MAG: hypothetical protein AB7I36_03760 [Rhodospirillaceae bacterium]
MRTQDAWRERASALVSEIVSIADQAASKDEIATAKMRIEARQWVVEKYLLKETAGRDEGAESKPISVTINAASDAV